MGKLFRVLVEGDPTAYLPNLAESLINLGIRLAEAGDKQEALTAAREAVNAYRLLAGADPAAYIPELAKSLWALAFGQVIESVSQSVALEEALDNVRDACRLYEQLTKQWPKIFEGRLRVAQITLTQVLQQLGSTPNTTLTGTPPKAF